MTNEKRISIRKFAVPVIDGKIITGIPHFGAPPETNAHDFCIMAIALMRASGVTLNADKYRGFAFHHRRWLRDDEIVSNLPHDEIAIVLVDESEAESLGKMVNGGDALLLFYHATQPLVKRWEEAGILKEISAKANNIKIDEIIEVKPSFFGISLNVNKLIKKLINFRK
jgi:hypothetical protein